MVTSNTNTPSTKYVPSLELRPPTICQPVFQPTFPALSWEPLEEVKVLDKGLVADPGKKSLLSAASKVITLTPALGTEFHGIDLRRLSDVQKDELCV
jgi:sulfonate dioxygenase